MATHTRDRCVRVCVCAERMNGECFDKPFYGAEGSARYMWSLSKSLWMFAAKAGSARANV
jgi:hypothetical protein